MNAVPRVGSPWYWKFLQPENEKHIPMPYFIPTSVIQEPVQDKLIFR